MMNQEPPPFSGAIRSYAEKLRGPVGDRSRGVAAIRVFKFSDVPTADERILDIVLLDMHHSWPNLGHDSIVRVIGEVASDLAPLLDMAGMSIRVISYEVRQSRMIPEPPRGRYSLYIGTGGPGHIDPHLNDGIAAYTQGIREDPSWEEPLFRLFDAILQCEDSALLAVCHTFGVLCRWAGIARPVLRGEEKGGKSSGIVENILTSDAAVHPWFRRFAEKLPDHRHFKALDSRLFDLIPSKRNFPDGMIPLAFETLSRGGGEGEGLTMIEFARDSGGIMPRILAVNHHPEIRDRRRQLRVLEEKMSRGEVSAEWYEERVKTLLEVEHSGDVEQGVMLTSQYSLVAPLRFHLYRLVRRRAAALGCGSDLHENQVLRFPSGTLDREGEIRPEGKP